MDKINVGVIGAGRIGQIHARNIKFRIPGAKLSAVADVNVEAARKVAAELEVPVVTGDYRLLLEDEIHSGGRHLFLHGYPCRDDDRGGPGGKAYLL